MLFSFVCLVQELVMLSKAKHLAMSLAVFPASPSARSFTFVQDDKKDVQDGQAGEKANPQSPVTSTSSFTLMSLPFLL